MTGAKYLLQIIISMSLDVSLDVMSTMFSLSLAPVR